MVTWGIGHRNDDLSGTHPLMSAMFRHRFEKQVHSCLSPAPPLRVAATCCVLQVPSARLTRGGAISMCLLKNGTEVLVEIKLSNLNWDLEKHVYLSSPPKPSPAGN